MAFKARTWTYSNEVDEPEPEPEAGKRYLYITGARMNVDNTGDEIYEIEFQDMENEAKFKAKYWMFTTERSTGNRIPNTGNRRVLVKLGKVLAGPMSEIGIPHPDDIIGGIVMGDVQLKESKAGNKYVAIYTYDPVPKEYAELAGIEQYYIGQENEIPEDLQ